MISIPLPLPHRQLLADSCADCISPGDEHREALDLQIDYLVRMHEVQNPGSGPLLIL